VIDYLQLLQSTKRSGRDNRVQEITEITTSLKALAKELNIPILALSQLSRQVEQRENKRPQLSDLRESGSIEQDADVVLFVFREAYYHALQKPDDDQKLAAWAARAEELHNRAEIIIAKHRHGPTTTVELNFEPDLTRFSCRERRYDSTPGSHENVYH
jgi:replicative DNA helicase